MGQILVSNVLLDAKAAKASLDAEKSTFVVGFCMGGSLSILSSTEDLDLTGAIGFYAGLSRVWGGAKGTALSQSTKVHNPFLGLFGGADQGIPVEQVREFDQNLDTAGVEHEIVIYEGAPHSFFDRRATEYADASSDAWARVQAFIQKYTA